VRFLLDTHVVLWQLAGTRRLGERAREAMATATELAFSVVSFAEIGVKASTGRLAVPPDLLGHVEATGLRVLGLSAEHALAVAGLPLHHRDPFDRLLVAQARHERLTLVSADARMAEYGVAVLDPLV
jgi:PIN domain nuclease of toxin-antitoxin system